MNIIHRHQKINTFKEKNNSFSNLETRMWTFWPTEMPSHHIPPELTQSRKEDENASFKIIEYTNLNNEDIKVLTAISSNWSIALAAMF